jgi:hypothetical protein
VTVVVSCWTDVVAGDVVGDGALGSVVTVPGSRVVLVGTVVVVDPGTVVAGVGMMLMPPFSFT